MFSRLPRRVPQQRSDLFPTLAHITLPPHLVRDLHFRIPIIITLILSLSLRHTSQRTQEIFIVIPCLQLQLISGIPLKYLQCLDRGFAPRNDGELLSERPVGGVAFCDQGEEGEVISSTSLEAEPAWWFSQGRSWTREAMPMFKSLEVVDDGDSVQAL